MSTRNAPERAGADVLYPNQAVRQSHPDHLASIARMFGMRPPPVDRCRVLELGCGAGRNLLPMADRHPESTFVGVDESPSEITMARRSAAAAGFEHVAFENQSPSDVDDRLGMFDYIIGHDVYSSVAPERQDALLAVCRARLNPQGVVYLSYRTLPGWIVPGVVREVIRSGSRQGHGVHQRIVQARQLLELVSRWLSEDESPYARSLRREADLARSLPDSSLEAEHLGAESHPICFHAFASQAANHGLQFFGDADTPTMFAERLGPGLQQQLAQFAHDDVSLQQLMDVLVDRRSHRSLLCHQNVTVRRQWTPAGLSGLYLSGNLRPDATTDQPGTDSPARFVASDGSAITTTRPAATVALAHLGRIWPRAIAFDELQQVVAARLTADGGHLHSFDTQQRDELGKTLVECLANDFVHSHSEPDRFVTTVSARPRAGRWAQAEAQAGLPITNRRHTPVALDEMSRTLLGYLDGRRDHDALLAVAIEAADSGRLSILRSGIPATQDETTTDILSQVLMQSLEKLAQSALLVA